MSEIKQNLKFPEGFYWGAATSSHQVEGNNYNDWTEWEKANPKIEKSGRACDHYNRFREDFDIAESLGHNAHRFSIEWSRIEPEEGKFNEKEIEHYRQVLIALKERGIEPFMTLYHWTLPLWLAKKGGWLSPKTPYYFDRYVKIVSENLFDYVKFWLTINEPNIYTSMSYLKGVWPPQRESFLNYFQALNNLARAHQLAYQNLHLIDLECQVGIAKNNVYFENIPLADYFWNKYFLNKIKNQQDFIGLNYYFHRRLLGNKNEQISDMGGEIYPKGIYWVLRGLEKYNKPVYIMENGIADAKDEKRGKFIREHLIWAHRAMEGGVDLRGYFYWSLLDNFEWDKGFWPRFGLVEINYETMERKIRPSAWEYKKIIENGL